MTSEAMPVMIAKRLNCSSTASPISACSDQEREGLRHAHLPRRDRPRPRPLDPGIEVAIGDVVPGAARAAHHEGADEEQHDDERQRRDVARRCRRPAPPTTSTASTAARIRSAGRNGRDADKAATRTARAYRPSCRWRRQRGPCASLIGAWSSRENVAVQRIEGAAALLRGLSPPAAPPRSPALR